MVAALTAKKYPYPTTYRLIRASLEQNVQEHRESDGFLVGAHVATAFWLNRLPEDLAWRETALARHRDIAGWILSRLNLTPTEVARAITAAQGLSAASEPQLRRFIAQLPP